MKKLALIAMLPITLLVISCKEKMTNQKRAENAVKHYLYNLYGDNVEIFGFKDFTTMKAYAEQSGKESYERWIKKNPADSVSIKKDSEHEASNILFGRKNWYKIECIYKAYNWSKVGENFYVDPEFKKVEKEMLITLLEKQNRYNQSNMASRVMDVPLFKK